LRTSSAVSRLQQGDPDTIAALRRLVWEILRTHSRDLEPYCDDLVSEVCAQVWRRVMAEGERVRNLEGLVAQITRARAIDLHRSRTRWRFDPALGERMDSIADPDPGPFEHLRHEERARYANALIAAVDERTRTIWRLRYFDGLKYREVALRLGLREGTVKRLVSESLRAATALLVGSLG
jgi:RNA polymerase sigma-70 factor, ECF subfamily